TAPRRCVADGLCRPARDVQPLQFSAREKAKRFSIRRPERKSGSLGIRNSPCFLRADLVEPNDAFARRFVVTDQGNRVPVGSDRQVSRGKGQRRREVHALWFCGLRVTPQESPRQKQ